MPGKTKKPAMRGTETFAPVKTRFDPGQGRAPVGLKPSRNGVGGRPMLFPGRTGGR